MACSGCCILGEHGGSCEGRQPRFFLDPLVVVGHPGVNPWTKLLGAAVAPADHAKQPEPVAELTDQRPSRVSLPERGAREENQQGSKKKASSPDLLGIPGKHPGSSPDERRKACCL